MDFPRVFILIRDYGESYFASFDEFKQHIAEVNFLDPKEREKSDLDEILIEAWNFLALFEEEEENQYEANNGPLTQTAATDSGCQWLENPWPWEMGGNR